MENTMVAQQFIDLTMDLDVIFDKFSQEEKCLLSRARLGHIGTHVDVMDTGGLSMERFISKAHIVDVSNIFDREIMLNDTNLSSINICRGDSILFRTDWALQKLNTNLYFKNHPFLSYELIDFLLDKHVNLICLDAPGIRRGTEHKDIDIYCANHNVFILENLINLNQLMPNMSLTLYCFPLKITKNTGITCRVIATQ